MNLRKSLNSWFTRMVFSVIVISTVVNCNCNSNNNNIRENNNDENNPHRKSNHKLNIELTAASDEVIDSDVIEFQLTNKGTEEIDLEQVISDLEITERKDFAGQPTNEGGIAPIFPNDGMNIHIGNGISGQSVAGFTEEKKLTPNKKVSIFIRVINLGGLGSALVNFQLKNATNHVEVANKSVTFKLTKPTGPKEDSSIEALIENVTFTNATKQLSYNIILKNTGNHSISLGSLKLDLEFNGPIVGTRKYTPKELFKHDNSILNPGQQIVIPSNSNITDATHIEGLQNAVGTDNFLTITPLITAKGGRVFYNLTQPVKLASPDLPNAKVGPIAGESTVGVSISNEVELKHDEDNDRYIAVFTILIKNNSTHIIDINQTNLNGSLITTPIRNNIPIDRQGGKQPVPIFIKQNEVYHMPLSIGLANLTKEEAKDFLSNNNFSFDVIMQTLDGSYVIGKIKQDVRLTNI